MHIPILSHFVMARGLFSPSMLGIMAATSTTSVRRDQCREHADEVARLLAEAYPDARCELDHDGPYQLLVATVLSAQTTDRRVNTVTPTLFSRWPDPQTLANADVSEVETVVAPLGFGPTRAVRLVSMAAKLVDEFDGDVPEARRRPQDRQCRPRQCLRSPRDHPGHPRHEGVAPARLDRRDHPGEGGNRSRRHLRPERLGDAVPPPHLARSSSLPFPTPSMWGLPSGRMVSLLW